MVGIRTSTKVCAALVGFVALFTSVGPASAAPARKPPSSAHQIGPDRPQPVGLDSTTLGTSATGQPGTVSPAAISPNPLNCKGQTDMPHWSGDDASVHGRTTCDWNAPALFVTTNLYRDRWYGWQFLDGRSQSAYGWWRTSDATPHWYCYGVGLYTYIGSSSHEADIAGVAYYGNTQYSNRFWC